jgi:hypothetical protein
MGATGLRRVSHGFIGRQYVHGKRPPEDRHAIRRSPFETGFRVDDGQSKKLLN